MDGIGEGGLYECGSTTNDAKEVTCYAFSAKPTYLHREGLLQFEAVSAEGGSTIPLRV